MTLLAPLFFFIVSVGILLALGLCRMSAACERGQESCYRAE